MDAAIQTSMMLHAAFKLSRRAVTLPVIQATAVSHGPLHVLIDSTGLQVYGAGRWLEVKYGAKSRRNGQSWIWQWMLPAE